MASTQRIYWQDAYRQCFGARIIERLTLDGRPGVVLDQTCFYATSGGQPHDCGTLNGVAVVEVIESEGRLVHLLAEPLTTDAVSGQIDWARRFDHMQQHSGQHILSAAFVRSIDAATVSFHLGDAICTIDIAAAELTPEQAQIVEDEANRIVFENHPVSVREHQATERDDLTLRKPPPAHEIIRIVAMDGYDTCACGGTHVRATGEIGPIHIRRWERRRGATRVEFLCGGRAVRDYAQRDAILQQVALTQSVGIDELIDTVTRIAESAVTSRQEADRLRRRLLDAELPQIAAKAEQIAGAAVICRLLADYDADNMRYIAQHLVATERTVVLLAVPTPTPQILFARSADLAPDMGQLLRAAASPFGGRGGGRPHMAQGGGIASENLQAVLDTARESLRAELS